MPERNLSNLLSNLISYTANRRRKEAIIIIDRADGSGKAVQKGLLI